uniref:Uncharacterized protein n=1 Tax=Micrurus carvalhoi TaxID=3147026 RepID=A0A2H6MVF7_9SAUR
MSIHLPPHESQLAYVKISEVTAGPECDCISNLGYTHHYFRVILTFPRLHQLLVFQDQFSVLVIIYKALDHGCQTGSPSARCITCRPHPSQFCKWEKHCKMSCDGNMMP